MDVVKIPMLYARAGPSTPAHVRVQKATLALKLSQTPRSLAAALTWTAARWTLEMDVAVTVMQHVPIPVQTPALVHARLATLAQPSSQMQKNSKDAWT